MDDPAVAALSELVPGGARRGELRRDRAITRVLQHVTQQ